MAFLLSSFVHLGHTVGYPVLVKRDGSPIHRRVVVEAIAVVARGRTQSEPLPRNAPDPNPAAWLWRQLKIVELNALTWLDQERLHTKLPLGLRRLRPRVIQSVFVRAG